MAAMVRRRDAAMGPETESRKRTRVAGRGPDDYDALAAQRASQACADGLGSPGAALALDALLVSNRLGEKERRSAEEALRALKIALDQAKAPHKAKLFTAADDSVGKLLRKVGRGRVGVGAADRHLGFHGELADVRMLMVPPAGVAVVGSFLVGLCASSSAFPLVVDVAVQMPHDSLQSKDYLNYKYHDKRLLYMALLVRMLRKSHSDTFADFAIGAHCLAGDPEKPVASFTLTAEPRVTIRLIPTISEDAFDWTKLAEDRRNVRPSGESSVDDSPTPSYNAGIVLDSLLIRHLTTIHAHVIATPAFPDAALMLRLWARRRRLLTSGFPIAALLANTISSGAAPARAAKEHLFRAALGIACSGTMASVSIDGARVAKRWDDGFLARWRVEASAALACLDAPGAATDAWGGVIPFLFATASGSICRSVPLCTVFDGFVMLRTVEKDITSHELLANEIVLPVLVAALVQTHRVARVEALAPGLFGLTFHKPSSDQDAYRKVDIRPDSMDVAAFQSFWGSKAEVRRFKDGRIVEALVWSGGLSVMSEIVKYACERHFGTPVTSNVILSQVEAGGDMLGVEHGSSRAIAVFNELSSALRKVDGLPLSIAKVLAVSPHLRRCGVQPVRPCANGKFIEPLDILAMFETSGAWPDDMLAMASAKAGFYLALKTGLALHGIASKPTVSFIDILLGGLVFRLRVCVDKEQCIAGLEKDTLLRLEWETESRVRLHEAMRNVPSLIFGDTARLFKRWLSSHFLLCEFGSRGEELVEMLTSRVLLVQHGRQPRSVFSAFCQCLHLLAEFPWEAAPLVVPLVNRDRDAEEDDVRNGYEDAEHRVKAEELYEGSLDQFARLSANGNMTLCVTSTLDADGEFFSGKLHGPERAVLKRASAAARAALHYIDGQLLSDDVSSSDKWTCLFRTPISAFHHVIAVDRAWVPRNPSLSRGPMYAGRPVARLDTALVGLDPVQRMVSELRRVLGRHAMFVWDVYGGSKIYLVWRPAAERVVPFSLTTLAFMEPVPDSKSLAPNKEEMLACIRRIGGGMINSISVPS
jgi:U3 small nucleolar RNA-associated protein 22